MKSIMVFGTFDIVHLGHIHLFEQAKKYAEKLIVVIARDVTVNNISDKKLVHNEKERKSFLTHIDLVDTVTLGDKKDVYKVIKEYKPEYIGLGYDQEHFVDGLDDYLQKENIDSTIVRFKSYHPEQYKSNNLRPHLN